MFFGLYFFLDALFQISVKLLKPDYYAWYSAIFQGMPERMIFLRYSVSVFFRIFELVVGAGLIFRKEIFRKAVLLMSCFSVLIVYWKHPFAAVLNHAQMVIINLSESAAASAGAGLDFSVPPKLIAWVALIFLYIFDIGIAALTVYYFTRPYIKEKFKD